uniref:G-protein coupled receptors family 1 profile domain-containing protein n=1 Tax=Clytia hemisphaerica TaxID=252671 RepID=A0A7M5VBK0_9CNID
MDENSTTPTCFTPYPRFHLSSEQKIILTIYNVLVNGVINMSLNLLVIYILIETKQIKMVAMRLILFVSISDVFGAVSMAIFIPILMLKNTCHFSMETITLFQLVLWGHMSGYTLALISYDRYKRVKLQHCYKLIMTPRRVHFMVLIVVMLAFIHAILFTLGMFYNKFFGTADKIVFAFDLTCLVCIFYFYVVFTNKTNQAARRFSAISTYNKNSNYLRTTNLVKRILIGMAFMFAIYCAGLIPKTMFKSYLDSNQQLGEVIFMVTNFMVHTNGALNAIILLYNDKKARKKVKLMCCNFAKNLKDEKTQSARTVHRDSIDD